MSAPSPPSARRTVGGATGDSFKWPSWLPIHINAIGIEWKDVENHPEDFVLTLSAAVTGLPGVSGLEFSGAIEGIKIDIGKLLAGEARNALAAGMDLSLVDVVPDRDAALDLLLTDGTIYMNEQGEGRTGWLAGALPMCVKGATSSRTSRWRRTWWPRPTR